MFFFRLPADGRTAFLLFIALPVLIVSIVLDPGRASPPGSAPASRPSTHSTQEVPIP